MSTAAKVLGVEMIDVEYADGTKSRFEMKRLSIRQLLQFCGHIRDGRDFELVCLCTGQPAEVVDRLTPQSFGLLVTKAWTENFQKAAPMIQASPVLAHEMLPRIQQLQGVALQTLQVLGALSLPEELPTESRADAASASSTSLSPTSLTPLPNAGESKQSINLESSTPSMAA